jgi:hypothetical protein
MSRRSWPVLTLVCAILLAATSLHAFEVSQQRASRPSPAIDRPDLAPSYGPGATPATPAGDDDCPDRSNPRPGSVDTRTHGPAAAGVEGRGWGWNGLVSAFSRGWIRVLVLFR